MGGGGSNTQTVKYELTPAQEEMVAMAQPYAQEFANQGLFIPEGSFIAPFTGLQQQGQQMAVDIAQGPQTDIAQTAAQSSQWLMENAADPMSNPALINAIEASQQPVWDQLTREVLPQIRSGATQAGQYGSSRQGIAEGIAISDAEQKAFDESSKIMNEAYKTGMDAAVKSLGVAPMVSDLALAPARTVSSVGDVQRELEQSLLEEQLGKITQEQLLPATVARELVTLASGAPGGGTFSQGPMANTSPAMQILGGLSVLSGLTGGFGGFGGGGGGSFLPFLFL